MRPAWIDVHNHLHDPRLGVPGPVIAAMQAAGVARCMVNATREDDWADVRRLAGAHPDFVIPAYGIHPWHAHTARSGWSDRLGAMLEENPAAGIGECGLDGWVESPGMRVQMPVFLDHLRVQRETRRPLTIHCLKAWGPLFDAFATVPPRPGFLMHSFGGSWESARRLLAMGAWFSFSGHFLHPRKAAVAGVFRKLPKDRILLETDAPDMRPPEDFITHPAASGGNHPANLPRIAEGLAAALGMDARELMPLIADNSRRFLGCGS